MTTNSNKLTGESNQIPNPKMLTLVHLQKNATQMRTFGYGSDRTAKDQFGIVGGGTYFLKGEGDEREVYVKSDQQSDTFPYHNKYEQVGMWVGTMSQGGFLPYVTKKDIVKMSSKK
jgi:hypothetical protein